jgi:hypothetical protein
MFFDTASRELYKDMPVYLWLYIDTLTVYVNCHANLFGGACISVYNSTHLRLMLSWASDRLPLKDAH